MKKITRKRIYVDHASLTPIDPRVEKAMGRANRTWSANPSSIHQGGVIAKQALSDARDAIANILGAHSDEIVFTSGGTEGNNLAIQGVVANYEAGNTNTKLSHVVTSAIEHSSVLETCRALEKSGRITVTYVMPEKNGVVDPKAVRAALKPETILVSIMFANNEIGTIQPIAHIAKEIRHYKKFINENKTLATKKSITYPLFHTDACQAMNYLEVNVESLGVDLLTFNGSKIYGPRGSGALYTRRKIPIASILYGGDQERGLRPGTESVANAVGLALALTYARDMHAKENQRLRVLQEYCFSLVEKNINPVRINGDRIARLPNNVNISIPGVSSERLVIELDALGIEASGKSACKSDDPEESYVIASLGDERSEYAGTTGSLRLSFGRATTKNDITTIVKNLSAILARIKVWH